jgi:GNAT superfamily N-acetyltransferase
MPHVMTEARLVRWIDLSGTIGVADKIADIMFEAARAPPPEGPMRDAFRYRWLDLFLAKYPNEAFVALGVDGSPTGYLVGCLEDPARAPEFAELGYLQAWSHLTRRFPAHLHINLTAAARGHHIGAGLVEAFCAHARARGVTGVHVVTGAASRNRTFYDRCGFAPQATLNWQGAEIVFLGRTLD